MRIEILTFEGCPNAEAAYELVREAARLEGIDPAIESVDVNAADVAVRVRFLGSPSVRVGGEDVEPAANERSDYGLMCRTYTFASETHGTPPISMIRAAIRRAIAAGTPASRDILTSTPLTGALFWLPAVLIVASGFFDISPGWRTAVWVFALTVMGVACAINAWRCGRVHCYVTGPFFLAMAIVALFYGLGVLPLGKHGWNLLGAAVLIGTIVLCCLPEMLLGRYRRSV